MCRKETTTVSARNLLNYGFQNGREPRMMNGTRTLGATLSIYCGGQIACFHDGSKQASTK
jgi:hypothetical protein